MSMRRALLAARRPSLRYFQPIQIEGLRACRANQAFHNCLFQSKTFSSETSTDPAAIQDQVQERRQRPRRDRDQNAARRRGAKNPFASKENFLERFKNVIEKDEPIRESAAYMFMKSCSEDLVFESEESRNELVNYVWSELEKKDGFEMNIGMWNTLLSVYVQNHYQFEPLEFLKDLWEKSKAEPNKSTFELLIQAYANNGDPNGAMRIVDFMTKRGFSMNESVCAWLVTAYANSGDMAGARDVVNAMRANGVDAKQKTYEHLMKAYAKLGDMDNMDQVMGELIEGGIAPTSSLYVEIFDSLSQGGHTHLIPQVWERIEDTSDIKQNLVTMQQKMITRDDLDGAVALLEIAFEDEKPARKPIGIRKSLFTRLFFSQKDIDVYLKACDILDAKFPEATLSHSNSIMDYMIFKNKPDKAFEVLDQLIANGKITTRHFHPLVKYFSDKNDLNGILDVLEKMSKNNVELDYMVYFFMKSAVGTKDSDTYKQFISEAQLRPGIVLPRAYTKSVFSNEDLPLDQMLQAVQNASSGDTFTSLPDIKAALKKNFKPVEGAKLIKTLQDKGMYQTGSLIGSTVQDLFDQQKPKELMLFMQTLMDLGITNISSYSYTKTLQSLYNGGLSEQFFAFVRSMKDKEVEPDAHQYFQMLKMSARVGNSMAAQFCFDKIQGTLDNAGQFYNYLIISYGRDGESQRIIPTSSQEQNSKKVVELYQQMEEKELKPSPMCCTMIIRSYLLLDDITNAKEVIKKHGDGAKSQRLSVYNAFMRAYIQRRDYQGAEELFELMKNDESYPKATTYTYNELMRACEGPGDVERVENLYKGMIKNGITPNIYSQLHRIRAFLSSKKPELCVPLLAETSNPSLLPRVDVFMTVLRHLVPTGDVENVSKVVQLIREHPGNNVPDKRLNSSLMLANIKSGNLDEASKYMGFAEFEDQDIEPVFEMNPIRKSARTAASEGDVGYVENMMAFLKQNNLNDKALDTFYLIACNQAGNFDGIKQLYSNRIEEGGEINEKFESVLRSIIEERGIKDISIPTPPTLHG